MVSSTPKASCDKLYQSANPSKGGVSWRGRCTIVEAVAPRQSSLAGLEGRLDSDSGSPCTWQQRCPLIGRKVALVARQVGPEESRRRGPTGIGRAKGWCHAQVFRCCTTRVARPSPLTRRHDGSRVLLYMLRPNTGSTRRGAESVEWWRRPRVGGALQYLLRSGDAVAKEVKQSRRADPLPTDSRLREAMSYSKNRHTPS
jgi:hypothetical protein